MKLLSSKTLRPHSAVSRLFCLRNLGVAAALALGAQSTKAATANFTNLSGDNQYSTALNWDTFAVPNTANGDVAIIGNGSPVTYNATADLFIGNGGSIQVTNGSFTQTGGNNYIQMSGNGSFIVSGGTFNQGTASSSPFNVAGTGNVFNMTSGAANLNNGFNVPTGLTSTLSGGTLTVTAGGTAVTNSLTLSGANASLGSSLNVNAGGMLSITAGTITANSNININGTFSMSGGTLTLSGELDYNNALGTLSGGTINTTRITGVNGTATGNHVFTISGGLLTISGSGFGGIYGNGPTNYINFTPGSNGQMEFLASTNDTIATVQNFISRNSIQYNNAVYNSTTGYSNFTITQDGSGNIFLGVVGAAVPEPSTFAVFALGVAGLMGWTLRRRVRHTV